MPDASSTNGSARTPLPVSRGERGTSLLDVLVVLALAGLALAITGHSTLAWIGREEVRSAIYTLQTYMYTARMQAVSRNDSCQFRLDSSTRKLQVFDLNDPAVTTDDILLTETTLSPKVSFVRPDAGSPITLALSSGTTYQATFTSDGVASGTGTVSVFGGQRYNRIDLFAAGGTKIWRWNGSVWVVGW